MPIAAGLYYFPHNEKETMLPPVILIHGAGGSHLYWSPEMRRLAGARIYAVDLPGHGQAEGIGHQAVEEYAQSILDFMDALKISRAVFVGHSMGSAVALTLALNHSSRALALGLVGGGARLRVAPEILAGVENESTFPDTVQKIVEYSFGEQTSPRLKELAAQRMAEMRPTVLHGDFIACNQFDVMEKVSALYLPTLIVCGTADRMTPLKYSEYLASKISNAQLKTIEDAGHMVMLENPLEVAQAFEAFLGDLSYRPGQ
jgi:pimeloyl-ACP methyl ester carboxylesterase